MRVKKPASLDAPGSTISVVGGILVSPIVEIFPPEVVFLQAR